MWLYESTPADGFCILNSVSFKAEHDAYVYIRLFDHDVEPRLFSSVHTQA